MPTPKYREAQLRLRSYISEKGLAAGDQLPAEADLAASFGISRLSLREAIKGLETVGVLKTRHGGGTYVEPFSFSPILENLPYAIELQSRDLRNLLEVRAALEEGLIGRASEWIRRRDLEALRELAVSMETATPERIAELDRQFHLRLYEPLDNPLVDQMIELFWEIFHRMQEQTVTSAPSGAELARLHLNIVDALADESDVVQAMSRHFDDIRVRLDHEA
ncbi:FCD domain-containing protein [Herbiconiux moechotypicola]|uniref:FadR/GntR family transcriptional regulator n=1 Tax=Herbiconiux moechotypicola TaxID=637393 RepID=A0ABN3E6B4_9MICO|nr:FCD domain-containing protein [Herbiconiux moechotypicola]MCS5731899.1 FCD domain-containing protein [Herbiconiux moechotypicola]